MRVLHIVNDALEETKFELYHDLVLGLAVGHALFWKIVFCAKKVSDVKQLFCTHLMN